MAPLNIIIKKIGLSPVIFQNLSNNLGFCGDDVAAVVVDGFSSCCCLGSSEPDDAGGLDMMIVLQHGPYQIKGVDEGFGKSKNEGKHAS